MADAAELTSTALPPRKLMSAVTERFELASGPVLLTGVQAVGRLLIEQHARDLRMGLRTASFVSGYRGSPLGGLDRVLAGIPGARDVHEIRLVPGLNEELAATSVWGSQVALPHRQLTHDGVIGVWYGKAPGVDRAGDPIRHGNMQGANPRGGVLVLAGDDPGAKSSTLPCASERTLAAYSVPVLYPRSSEEIITFGLYGVALSRATGCWIGMKIVADVADGLWSVDRNFADLDITVPEIEWNGSLWQHVQVRAATLPWTRTAEEELVGPRWKKLLAFADANPLDVLEVGPREARFGIVAAGKTYSDTAQALADLGLDQRTLHSAGIRLLRLGMLYPLAPGVVRRFAEGLDTILVIEEKKPFVETQLRELLYGSAAPRIIGKNDLIGERLIPAHGALYTAQITAALRRVLPGDVHVRPPTPERDSVPQLDSHRTAYFCSGCPHNRSTVVLEGSFAGGGIGCHAMALRMPQNSDRMTGITQMGGEGAQWIGQSQFTDTPHLFQNMGDGTYFHSGQLAVQACVAAGSNITFKLLYNSAVAMTGGQDVDGALAVPALTRKLAAEGVRRIIVCADEPGRHAGAADFAPGVSVWHRDRLDEAQRVLRDTRGVTVLIYDQVCAAESRRLRKRGLIPQRSTRVAIHRSICEGCGDCGSKSNCLSIQPVETELGRKRRIDHSSCNLDYSCLDGECPSFITVELDETAPPAAPAKAAQDLPEPSLAQFDSTYDLLLAGIGGTGVVTVNHILAAAARCEGLHVSGLDQTGLSQKAGPVTSHLRVSRDSTKVLANRIASRGLDCYLALDALVGAEQEIMSCMDPMRTKAVISTSATPTGAEVRFVDARSPSPVELAQRIRSNAARCELVDSLGIARQLFGSTASANLLMVGAAYQMGALPMRAASIEAAIATNAVAVDMNIAAFRWGRALVHDPDALIRRMGHSAGQAVSAATGDAFVAGRSLAGETRRLAAVRATHLAQYQNEGAARRYLDLLEGISTAERRVGSRTEFSEAAARGLHQLMAYKDEYEVARLLVSAETEAQLTEELGRVRNIRYRLQPPLLQALGFKKKISLSTKWKPLLRMLAAGKVLRGTSLDIFGWASIRRLERALIVAYVELLTELAATLTAENYDRAAAAAASAEIVRGYEHVKLANVKRFVARLAELGCRSSDFAQALARSASSADPLSNSSHVREHL